MVENFHITLEVRSTIDCLLCRGSNKIRISNFDCIEKWLQNPTIVTKNVSPIEMQGSLISEL